MIKVCIESLTLLIVCLTSSKIFGTNVNEITIIISFLVLIMYKIETKECK